MCHFLDCPTELVCDVQPPCTFVDAFTRWFEMVSILPHPGWSPTTHILMIWKHQKPPSSCHTIRLRSLLEISALGSETPASARRSASAPGCQMARGSGIAFRRAEWYSFRLLDTRRFGQNGTSSCKRLSLKSLHGSSWNWLCFPTVFASIILHQNPHQAMPSSLGQFFRHLRYQGAHVVRSADQVAVSPSYEQRCESCHILRVLDSSGPRSSGAIHCTVEARPYQNVPRIQWRNAPWCGGPAYLADEPEFGGKQRVKKHFC